MKRKVFLQLLCFVLTLTACCTVLSACARTDNKTADIGVKCTDGTVTFSADDDTAVAAGSHYVLLAGKREIQIFNEKGKRIYYKQTQLNDPEVLVNGACFLIYDKNGSACFLFRNGNCLAELQPDYPVYAACLDSSGSFALVTRTYASVSAVLWYDASGELKGTVERSDYTVDCAITSAGRLILLTVDADGGEWVTAVSSYKVVSAITVCTYEKNFRGVYPYQCTAKGNRIAVACSSGVYLLNGKGKTESVDVGDVTSYSVLLQSNGRTVLLHGDTVTSVDVRGKVQEYTLPLGAEDNAALYGDWLFLTQDKTIVRMNLKKGTVVTGTAQNDFDGIVLKNTAGQVYLKTASSLMSYDVK